MKQSLNRGRMILQLHLTDLSGQETLPTKTTTDR